MPPSLDYIRSEIQLLWPHRDCILARAELRTWFAILHKVAP